MDLITSPEGHSLRIHTETTDAVHGPAMLASAILWTGPCRNGLKITPGSPEVDQPRAAAWCKVMTRKPPPRPAIEEDLQAYQNHSPSPPWLPLQLIRSSERRNTRIGRIGPCGHSGNNGSSLQGKRPNGLPLCRGGSGAIPQSIPARFQSGSAGRTSPSS